ncbi:MAG TPA: sigma-E factor negative regulatory protein [Castellaniella sp.]|jgi:sigma-E factor negative regulatory protein RseA|nr:sigma-E factor negative regulatory protein [Castellaniella sp.]
MNTRREPQAGDQTWESSVSAWVDGQEDLRADELDTPYARQLWDTYHLIGDVMRSEELAIQPSSRFYARVSAALDGEPAIVAPGPIGRRHLLRLSLSGVAVAAAVVSVVWMARPALFGGDDIAVTAPVVAEVGPADPGLAPYMDAHQAMAGTGPVRQVSYDGMESN